jgi:hypothetical protein
VSFGIIGVDLKYLDSFFKSSIIKGPSMNDVMGFLIFINHPFSYLYSTDFLHECWFV